MQTRRTIMKSLRGAGSLVLLAGLICLLPGGPDRPAPHACRFWAVIGSGYPRDLVTDHLCEGTIANLHDLGGIHVDGWGFGSYLRDETAPLLDRPLTRRGGPPANHPTDPDFKIAVNEIGRLRPKAAIGHVRSGTTGHWGIPNPHPFQHQGMLFAHNGTVSTEILLDLLTEDDPDYLRTHPPDYVEGYIDSELYFLYLLKYIQQNPTLRRAEAIRRAVRELARKVGGRLNFVATSGDTLFALRYAPYDEYDPVRYSPAVGAGEASPYWVVASQIVGSDADDWGTIPSRTLAVFVPNHPPTFLPVDPEGQTADPRRPEVGRVHPNPVRGRIEIPITIPRESAEIGIEIWDIQGRLIWREGPVRRVGTLGSLFWDGRDLHGTAVASGTYFCRVTVGGRSWKQAISIVH